MAVTFGDLIRHVSMKLDDVVTGMASAAGTATTLVDSRLAANYNTDDTFNGGTLILNSGSGRMIWVENCESVAPGNFTAITITDSACRVHRDKAWKATGKYSYKCVTGSDASDVAYAYYTLPATYATVFVQDTFRATGTPVGVYDFLVLAQAGGTAILSVRLDANGLLSVYNTAGTAAYTLDTATTFTEGERCIEIGAVISATVGRVDLWVDGVQVLSRRVINTGTTSVGRVVTGIYGTSDASARTLWFDDVLVDQEYIGTRAYETTKTITDYTGETGTTAWSGNLVATAVGTEYMILDWPDTRFSRQRKKDALNRAIGQAWPMFFSFVTDPATDSGDASVEIAAQTFRYALPDNCMWIAEVLLEPSTTYAPYRHIDDWTVDGPEGAKYLNLPNADAYTAGDKVRIVYVARPTEMSDDNDELTVDPAYARWAQEYIVNLAMYDLWMQFPSPTPEQIQVANAYYARAQMIEKTHAMRLPPAMLSVPIPRKGRTFTERIAPMA